MGWVDVASEDLGPLLAGLDLAGRGKEAKIISIVLGASFSTGGCERPRPRPPFL